MTPFAQWKWATMPSEILFFSLPEDCNLFLQSNRIVCSEKSYILYQNHRDNQVCVRYLRGKHNPKSCCAQEYTHSAFFMHEHVAVEGLLTLGAEVKIFLHMHHFFQDKLTAAYGIPKCRDRLSVWIPVTPTVFPLQTIKVNKQYAQTHFEMVMDWNVELSCQWDCTCGHDNGKWKMVTFSGPGFLFVCFIRRKKKSKKISETDKQPINQPRNKNSLVKHTRSKIQGWLRETNWSK